MIIDNHCRQSWKKYQKRLKRKKEGKKLLNRLPFIGAMAIGFFVLILVIVFSGSWIYAHFIETEPIKLEGLEEKWSKRDLASRLVDFQLVSSPSNGHYVLSKNGNTLQVETTIDPGLQKFILRLLKRSRTHQAAVVALNPGSGRILAMADYEKSPSEEHHNICLQADIPAASLFKIISVAAAIEACEFSLDQPMFFNGKRHTLYKSQLRQKKNRYTQKTDLKRAFSVSNNPVFGKMGIYDLGSELMVDYSNKFMFNHAIPFDLPLDMSSLNIPNDDFELAELASGFNKQTKLSPLHAALITSAVVNGGTMMEPWLVKKVRDETGDVKYRAGLAKLSNPITDQTAKKLKLLMENTLKRGTCRTAFRPLMRKKIFNDIDLGAKTGTINDPLDLFKYDWITIYAVPKNHSKRIAIAVLTVHGKKLGTRAKDLAREILNYRFTS